MTNMGSIVQVIGIWLYLSIVVYKECNARLCLSCTNLVEGELCQHLVRCNSDEVCYIQKYVNENNTLAYDVGCAKAELCQTSGQVKRAQHSHIKCNACCNNTDVCNSDLPCKDAVNVVAPVCLSCSDIDDPRFCVNYTSCNSNEVCYMHKYKTESGKNIFDLGCKHSSLCSQGFNFDNGFGKRSDEGRHFDCERCCSGFHCNKNLECAESVYKVRYECADVPDKYSGGYQITPDGTNPVMAYCIMDSRGKWTVIQRRNKKQLRFDVPWQNYKTGFGDVLHEYWIGNDNIHALSTKGHHEMSIYLKLEDGTVQYANYSSFRVGNEQEKYILNIAGYSGNIRSNFGMESPDAGKANGQMFSTSDVDNDHSPLPCSRTSGGNSGWWYNSCQWANLNKNDKIFWDGLGNIVESMIMIKRNLTIQ